MLVSIPKRVLEALNLSQLPESAPVHGSEVSIPKRVLEALNLFRVINMVCNLCVSIPKRVLEALNLELPSWVARMGKNEFQSLKGFWRL